MLTLRRRHAAGAIAFTAAAGTIAIVASATMGGAAQPGLTAVPNAMPKIVGTAQPSAISPEVALIERARGSMKLENGTASIPFYGYDGDGPQLPAAGDLPRAANPTATPPDPGHLVEATKTEPDKNTYLVLANQHGAVPNYNYGTHFVFQGHEGGSPGMLTRINLDADGAHRVTLMASHDVNGDPLPVYDGSTWDPFDKHLLLTTEDSSVPGVYQATATYPSQVQDLDDVLGRGGYEGIQLDPSGRVWITEDQGGPAGAVNTHAKQPNSFIFRFTPTDKTDLTQGGRLQALQVISLRNGNPIVFHAGQADADITSADRTDLHTYGKVFNTRWVTVHDTASDGFGSFDANALAKANNATPFKRPENGVFQPATNFSSFVFSETGDTNADTEAGSQGGGFGALYELDQANAGAPTGKLHIVYRGDKNHNSFDNLSFSSGNTVLVAEDRGDTEHTQLGQFDSLWAIRTDVNYGLPQAPSPVRVMYVGRDASATIDSALGAYDGFQNEGDNEVTGIQVSDGDASMQGILDHANPEVVPRQRQGQQRLACLLHQPTRRQRHRRDRRRPIGHEEPRLRQRPLGTARYPTVTDDSDGGRDSGSSPLVVAGTGGPRRHRAVTRAYGRQGCQTRRATA